MQRLRDDAESNSHPHPYALSGEFAAHDDVAHNIQCPRSPNDGFSDELVANFAPDNTGG